MGRWGTITMPDAGRNRKARSGALLLKNTLDIGRYSKYKTHPQGGRAASGVSPLQAQPGGMTPFDPRRESEMMKEGYEHTSHSRHSHIVYEGSSTQIYIRTHRQFCTQLRSRAHCGSPGATARNAPYLT